MKAGLDENEEYWKEDGEDEWAVVVQEEKEINIKTKTKRRSKI